MLFRERPLLRQPNIVLRALHQPPHLLGETAMLNWAILFLIVALIAGVLGFGGVMGTAAWIAKVLFVVFLILFVVSLISGRRVKL